MTMCEMQVIADEIGERADSLITRRCPSITRSAAQRLFEDGLVSIGGIPIKKSYRATGGEILLVALPDVADTELAAQNIPLDIIWEDNDLIVVNKPRGMVVHPAPGHADNTLVNALLHHCGDSLSGIGGVSRPGIVHRIDKDTSGLIIAAKNDFSHRSLSAQLRDRTLSRIYEAVAHGRFQRDSGIVNASIGRHHTDRKRMAVTERGSARTAVTEYEVLARFGKFTHIRCRLQTGRTHQIRVHMAYIGHPLLGDPVYGSKKDGKNPGGQCLHARFLKFRHPRTGADIELSCELPEYFRQILKKLEPAL